ncbi:MAG TPA: hypothetical protein VFJ58_12465 [Armatimonadota bacterium]|nr:hypothetical protein [Armatimonadota bacterium]
MSDSSLLVPAIESRSPAGSDAAGRTGDLILTFGEGSHELNAPARSGGQWKLEASDSSWRLFRQPPGNGWRGAPVRTIHTGPWNATLIGELYGGAGFEPVAQLLDDHSPAVALNGHFLLFAWNRDTREWHVWTDRFGTMHAYHATDGTRAALGTFSPAVAAVASGRKLDWRGITGFCAFGFFPQDRTFFDDVRILRPASHFRFSADGKPISEERYWRWSYHPDDRRSYEDTLAEFGDIFSAVMRDLTRDGRIALPLSGGLDSRTTAIVRPVGAALPAEDPIWAYSYGYSVDSDEIRIAREIAGARKFPFQAFVVEPYLFGKMDHVLSSLEGFQDVTLARQASVVEELGAHADSLIAAHWGDVWMDDMGFADAAPGEVSDEQALLHAIHKMEKGGREWLLGHLCRPHLGGESPDAALHEMMGDEMARVRHVADPDFRVRALKTDQWSFRWTTTSLRMFQAAVFPRLPFYDTRLADFFSTVPAKLMRGRALQIEYLKRYAPDLARIRWQEQDADLFNCQHHPARRLPRRVLKKVWRMADHRRRIQRNWEVQFLSASGRSGLESYLLRPGLRIHDLVPAAALRDLVGRFFKEPLAEKRGYTVSMALTISAWLEKYG